MVNLTLCVLACFTIGRGLLLSEIGDLLGITLDVDGVPGSTISIPITLQGLLGQQASSSGLSSTSISL